MDASPIQHVMIWQIMQIEALSPSLSAPEFTVWQDIVEMTRKIQEVDYKIAAWLILDWAGEGRAHTGIQNG